MRGEIEKMGGNADAQISHPFHMATAQLSQRSSFVGALTPAPSMLRGASIPTPSSTVRRGLHNKLTAPVNPIRRRNPARSRGPSPNPSPGWIARSMSSPCPIVALGTQGTTGPCSIGCRFAHTRAHRWPRRHLCLWGEGIKVNFWQQPRV